MLTPHVTWYTVDTMRRYLVEAVANCRRLRDGQRLAHVVNRPHRLVDWGGTAVKVPKHQRKATNADRDHS